MLVLILLILSPGRIEQGLALDFPHPCLHIHAHPPSWYFNMLVEITPVDQKLLKTTDGLALPPLLHQARDYFESSHQRHMRASKHPFYPTIHTRFVHPPPLGGLARVLGCDEPQPGGIQAHRLATDAAGHPYGQTIAEFDEFPHEKTPWSGDPRVSTQEIPFYLPPRAMRRAR
jgi:hypothetical protein